MPAEYSTPLPTEQLCLGVSFEWDVLTWRCALCLSCIVGDEFGLDDVDDEDDDASQTKSYLLPVRYTINDPSCMRDVNSSVE